MERYESGTQLNGSRSMFLRDIKAESTTFVGLGPVATSHPAQTTRPFDCGTPTRYIPCTLILWHRACAWESSMKWKNTFSHSPIIHEYILSLSLSYSRRIRSSQVPETSTSTSGRPTQDRCSTRSRLITTASAVFCSLMMAVSSSPVPWTVWCMSSSPMNWLDRRRLWDVKSSCCLRTVLIQDKEIPMYLIAEL